MYTSKEKAPTDRAVKALDESLCVKINKDSL